MPKLKSDIESTRTDESKKTPCIYAIRAALKEVRIVFIAIFCAVIILAVICSCVMAHFYGIKGAMPYYLYVIAILAALFAVLWDQGVF